MMMKQHTILLKMNPLLINTYLYQKTREVLIVLYLLLESLKLSLMVVGL